MRYLLAIGARSAALQSTRAGKCTRYSVYTVPYVNPAFCALVGKTREELIGSAFAGIVAAGEECLSLLDRVYRTGDAETHTGNEHSAAQASTGSMRRGRLPRRTGPAAS